MCASFTRAGFSSPSSSSSTPSSSLSPPSKPAISLNEKSELHKEGQMTTGRTLLL